MNSIMKCFLAFLEFPFMPKKAVDVIDNDKIARKKLSYIIYMTVTTSLLCWLFATTIEEYKQRLGVFILTMLITNFMIHVVFEIISKIFILKSAHMTLFSDSSMIMGLSVMPIMLATFVWTIPVVRLHHLLVFIVAISWSTIIFTEAIKKFAKISMRKSILLGVVISGLFIKSIYVCGHVVAYAKENSDFLYLEIDKILVKGDGSIKQFDIDTKLDMLKQSEVKELAEEANEVTVVNENDMLQVNSVANDMLQVNSEVSEVNENNNEDTKNIEDIEVVVDYSDSDSIID